jgi:hypothetical protein
MKMKSVRNKRKMQCKVYKHERDCVCINMKFSLLNNDVLGKLHYYYESERNDYCGDAYALDEPGF